jgi:hypothetical protein
MRGTIRLSILRVKCRPVVSYTDGAITDITNTHGRRTRPSSRVIGQGTPGSACRRGVR